MTPTTELLIELAGRLERLRIPERGHEQNIMLDRALDQVLALTPARAHRLVEAKVESVRSQQDGYRDVVEQLARGVNRRG